MEIKENMKDITGMRFGRLVAIRPVDKNRYGHGGTIWECKCDCGNIAYVTIGCLNSGNTRSCGCLASCRLPHRKHRLYRIWQGMKQRCYNTNAHSFKNYGGRGISVCEEWLGEKGYDNFYEWAMNNGYSDELTIDRIDVNGDYKPSNCRWANNKQQGLNKRNNRNIKFNGEEMTLTEWAEKKGIDRRTLNFRIDYMNWPLEQALNLPAYPHNSYLTYKGETKSIGEWSRITGLSRQTIEHRLNMYGWSVDEALSTPARENNKWVTFNGETKNLTEWANSYGLSYSALRGRLSRGWAFEDAISTPLITKHQKRKEKT